MAERQTIRSGDVGDLSTVTNRTAHMVFKQKGEDAPTAVRVNLPDGSPKDIPLGDAKALEEHGLVECPNCGAPNHVMQLADAEQPWIQCGCTGRRVEVKVGKAGREYVKMARDAMIERVNAGRGAASRG